MDVYVCSAAFAGLKVLERHRLVNGIVTEAGLFSRIHALTIKAWTADEWEARQHTIPQSMQQAQQDVTTPR